MKYVLWSIYIIVIISNLSSFSKVCGTNLLKYMSYTISDDVQKDWTIYKKYYQNITRVINDFVALIHNYPTSSD